MESAMTETLVVVGNAEPQEDWSAFIDSMRCRHPL